MVKNWMKNNGKVMPAGLEMIQTPNKFTSGLIKASCSSLQMRKKQEVSVSSS